MFAIAKLMNNSNCY